MIFILIFQIIILIAVMIGAVREADLVWQMGDIGVGLMAWGTVLSILFLYRRAIGALREYEKQLKIEN